MNKINPATVPPALNYLPPFAPDRELTPMRSAESQKDWDLLKAEG